MRRRVCEQRDAPTRALLQLQKRELLAPKDEGGLALVVCGVGCLYPLPMPVVNISYILLVRFVGVVLGVVLGSFLFLGHKSTNPHVDPHVDIDHRWAREEKLREEKLDHLTPLQREHFLGVHGIPRKLFFAHGTKAAGTSVNGALKLWAEMLNVQYHDVRSFNEVLQVKLNATEGIYTTEVPRRFWAAKARRAGYLTITVLREPLDRCMSWFYFRKAQADTRPKYAEFLKIDFYQFLRQNGCRNYYLNNLQTAWQFPWRPTASPRTDIFQKSPPLKTMLRTVLPDLQDNFLVVGVANHVTETLQCLQKLTGWPEAPILEMNRTRLNVNSARKQSTNQ
eukprot:1188706-Prorocentrum_minimum.AAC.4